MCDLNFERINTWRVPTLVMGLQSILRHYTEAVETTYRIHFRVVQEQFLLPEKNTGIRQSK